MLSRDSSWVEPMSKRVIPWMGRSRGAGEGDGIWAAVCVGISTRVGVAFARVVESGTGGSVPGLCVGNKTGVVATGVVKLGTEGVVLGLFVANRLGEAVIGVGEPERGKVGVESASAGEVNSGVGRGRQPANCPMSVTNKIPIKNVLHMRISS